MSGILRLESLTKGNTLKQGDKTPLKYRLFDADGEKLNIVGKSAKVRLVYPDFLTIGYEKGGLTVAQDDTVTFTIDSVIPSRIYHVEIIVDDNFIFPSRADEAKFTVDKSSLGTEANIIEIVGVDQIVNKVLNKVDTDISQVITDVTATNDAIQQAEQERVQGYQEIKQLIEDEKLDAIPADGSVTTEKLASESVTPVKTSFFESSENLLDKTKNALNTRLNEVLGTTYSASGWQTSDFIPVVGGENYTASVAYTINFYDASNSFVSSIKEITGPRPYSYTVPINAEKLKVDMRNADVESYMIAKGDTLPDQYQTYYNYIPLEYIEPFTEVEQNFNDMTIDSFSDDFLLRPDLPSGTDLNTVFDDGVYTGKANGNYLNLPKGFDTKYAFRLINTSLFKGGNRWAIQSFVNYSILTQEWRRVIDKTGAGTSEWQVFGGTNGVTESALKGKVIVNFGDSIFGNTQGANSVSQSIQDRTGATVYNVAFGGSQMSTHAQYWDAFSAYNLADAIVNKDWALVDDPNARNLRNYFPNSIDTLKTIDFTKVDFITFNWGTNDYRQGKALDDEANDENTNTFAGAMRYFLKTITEAYPEIKILVISPLWRYFNDGNGEYLEDSTVKSWGGGTLLEFVNKGIEVANEFNIPYLNAYQNLGINKHNRLTYFNDSSGDTTHPLPNGNKRLGSLIGAKLISSF